MKLIVIILSFLALESCGTEKAITNTTTTEMSKNSSIAHFSGEFTITVLNNNTPSIKNITLNFDAKENSISGFSGCNRYSGKYTTKGNSLTFSDIMTTKMYCSETDTTERLVLECLSKTNSYLLEGDKLTLKANENTLLIAEKKSTIKEKVQVIDAPLVIYDSHTRGYHFTLTVYEKYATVIKTYKGEPLKIEVTEADLQAVKDALAKISVDKISAYKAPTELRHRDAAQHTSVVIMEKGEKYSSQTFDGGHPPKELADLVNKILSLTAEK